MSASEPLIVLARQIPSDNPSVRVNTGALQTLPLDLAAGWHYAAEDDAVQALEDGLNENSDGVTFTCSVSDEGFLTIDCDVSSSILWGDVLTTLDPALLGFEESTTTGTSHVAPFALMGWWLPGRAYAEDPRAAPIVVGAFTRALSGLGRGYDLSADYGDRRIAFPLVAESVVLTEFGASSRPYGCLDWLWSHGMATGTPVRVYDDHLSRGPSDYAIYTSANAARPWKDERVSNQPRYRVTFDLIEAEATDI